MQPKWSGQCPTCKEWNTFSEEAKATKPARIAGLENVPVRAYKLSEIKTHEVQRCNSCYKELDRLLGSGIVPGSLTLLGGDPGIGKSTLLLQVAASLANTGKKVLYICGEESTQQVFLRSKRLKIQSEDLLLLAETELIAIKNHIETIKPDFVIVDSIQIVYKSEVPSLPGSISQIRECATDFLHLAKGLNIAVFLIGHVTKTGEIAGPRVLEHLVDTVLYFEGDRQHHYRILRAVKNRFGPTDEIAVFNMCLSGLEEIKNPSNLFLEERTKEVIGSTIIPTIEGSMPLLIETQALVADSPFSAPTRKSSGLDSNRLALLLAVLEKRVGYPMGRSDVFVSIAGGLKITEPAIDLGVLMAITSSYRNQKIDTKTAYLGEVGLSGDVRRVPRVDQRLKELYRMGFEKCYIPEKNLKSLTDKSELELIGIDFVDQAIEMSFST